MSASNHPSDTVLPPEMRGCRTQFVALKQEAQALTEGLSSEAFNQQPAPGKWSVGQCLDHLNETGYRLVPRLEATLRDAHGALESAAARPFRYRWTERMFIRMNGPDPPFRLPTPSVFRPAQGGLEPARVTADFLALQDRFLACIEEAHGVDLARLRVTSPASRWVRLSVGAWLAAMAAHEERHLNQARRALASLSRP